MKKLNKTKVVSVWFVALTVIGVLFLGVIFCLILESTFGTASGMTVIHLQSTPVATDDSNLGAKLWFTDQSGELAKRLDDGNIYTAHFQFISGDIRSYLAFQLSQDLLSEGITITPNGKSVFLDFYLTDGAGKIRDFRQVFKPAHDYAVTMRFVSGSAEVTFLGTTICKPIADHDLFVVGTNLARLYPNGFLAESTVCQISYRVRIDRADPVSSGAELTEPAPATESVASTSAVPESTEPTPEDDAASTNRMRFISQLSIVVGVIICAILGACLLALHLESQMQVSATTTIANPRSDGPDDPTDPDDNPTSTPTDEDDPDNPDRFVSTLPFRDAVVLANGLAHLMLERFHLMGSDADAPVIFTLDWQEFAPLCLSLERSMRDTMSRRLTQLERLRLYEMFCELAANRTTHYTLGEADLCYELVRNSQDPDDFSFEVHHRVHEPAKPAHLPETAGDSTPTAAEQPSVTTE